MFVIREETRTPGRHRAEHFHKPLTVDQLVAREERRARLHRVRLHRAATTAPATA